MLRDTLPAGFRVASSSTGLLVPEDTPRVREVWTKDESKLLDRALQLLRSRGISLQLRCEEPECRGEKMAREVNAAGEPVLRCQHRDRVFTRAL